MLKKVNGVGWLMILIAFLLGLRHFVPQLNSLMGNPSHGVQTVVVILTATCFGLFGIKPRE